MFKKTYKDIYSSKRVLFFFKLHTYYVNQAKTADRKLIVLFCQQKVKAKSKERRNIIALLKHEKHTF